MAIRLIIADDHPVVIEGMKLMLHEENDINWVYEAKNGYEVIQFLKRDKADIVIMDIEMPEWNGVVTTTKINIEYPDVKVIAFSNFSDYSHLQSMLKAGAKGYLLKNSSKQEVIEALHKVHQGGTYFSEDLTELMMAMVQGKIPHKENSGKFISSLSRREKEILRMICDEATTPEIAEKLFITIGTVETHRRNMMNKLDVKNTAGLVRTAIQYNLLDE